MRLSKEIPSIKQKLEKANNIIQEISQNEQHITPVTPDDQALFESFFKKETKHTYGNSWIYITQGVFGIGPHNLGYKYYDGENLCMLCTYPKIEDSNTIPLYWIRPMGKSILDVIDNSVKTIGEKYNLFTCVKKIFVEQRDYLILKGFKNAPEFPWHSTCHSEDDTYPELLLNRESTLQNARTASKRSRLGRAFREASKLAAQNNIRMEEQNFEEAAWHIAQEYFKDYALNRNKNFSSIGDYYNMIFQNPSKTNLRKKLILVNNIPAGFCVFEEEDSFDTANLFGMILLKHKYKYLSDYTILKILKIQRTTYLNLGGSEDEQIHCFKKKYNPALQNQMFWVVK